MRFAVPQFIDVEDKIFGPLTFKQFVYLAGGGGMSFFIIKLVPNLFLGIILASPFAAFAIGLAFVKINDKPLINIVEAGFMYIFSDKLYTWKHQPKLKQKAEKIEETERVAYLPHMSASKLHDIAWGLDVLDKK